MNHLIVNKIGGSILKSPNQLESVVKAILNQKAKSIVVVSALFGVTDQLINALHEYPINENHLETIKNSHIQWLENSPFIENLTREVNHLQNIFHQLETDIIQYKIQKDQYIYARVLSAGERLSSIIVSHYFNEKAKVLFPESIKLYTSNNALHGEYVSNNDIRDKQPLSGSVKYIIPGFYGINNLGQVCLTGRGGSDYTAAFLASELHANELVFWKDSNGIQTANPTIVKNAENVADINLLVLEQMTQVGSKILHPSVTKSLTHFEGAISFRNPISGNHVLTNIHTKNSSPGKAIIVDAPCIKSRDKCQVTIITRNITVTLIAIQKLKNKLSNVKILNVSVQSITFEISQKDKSISIQELHNIFHHGHSMSNQPNPATQKSPTH